MPPASSDAAASADELLVAGATTLGIQLDTGAVAAFRAYREDLIRWSERMNLTALNTPAEIVRQGFLDSLACAASLPPSRARILDVGSGAGFPAIPLALVRPGLDFTLVEPSRRKVNFLRHVVRRLGLTSVSIRPERLETLLEEKRLLEAFDIALARAVAPLPDVGRMVLPFLRPSGIFLAQIGAAVRIDVAMASLRAEFETMEERTIPAEFGKPGRRILSLKKFSRR